MNSFSRWQEFELEILANAALLTLIEDFRVQESEGFQFLVAYYKAGKLESATLLLGDPRDWCAGILREKKSQGVPVANPEIFARKKDFEQYAASHPVLQNYQWDWPQIAEKVKSF